MAIEYATGDIFEADVEALVVPVNLVGIAGKGLALEFKHRFPEWFDQYEQVCRNCWLVPGSIYVHDLGFTEWPRYIFDFPTKRHWRDESRIEDIEAGLARLIQRIEEFEIESLALPAIGCGLGSLRWSDVRPMIEAYMGNLKGVQVVVYEPKGGSR